MKTLKLFIPSFDAFLILQAAWKIQSSLKLTANYNRCEQPILTAPVHKQFFASFAFIKKNGVKTQFQAIPNNARVSEILVINQMDGKTFYPQNIPENET